METYIQTALKTLMTPERYRTIVEVLNQRQPDLTVITDEVHKGRNLSAIIRTCDAVGIPYFHCVEPKLGFRAFRGTSLGSHKWVDTFLHDNITSGIEHLKHQGMQIVAAHLSNVAVDYREIDYTQPTALLMGTEKQGVSDEALALVDHQVIIPMKGMVESYNVSAACAIILSEAQYQRQKAGLYDHCRLPDPTMKAKLFQACQPAVAQFCDSRGLAYPPLGEDGCMVNPSAWYAEIRAREEESS